MEFFDKKQDVLDVKLTPYGRYLLSIGRLKPSYYSFFDDDIIYDGKYAGLTETQNDIEDRIIRNSPRLKQQATYTGIETNFKRQTKLLKSASQVGAHGHELVKGQPTPLAYMNYQHSLERDYSLGMPLGKTSLDNDKPPSWRALMMSGKITSSTRTLEDQTVGSSLRIPQLNIDLTYYLTAHNINTESREELEFKALKKNNHVQFSPIFDDGTYLKIEGQHILMMLEEMNVQFEKENFDIEVYEEVIEEKRILEKVQGILTVVKKKQVDHFPLFFGTQPEQTFEDADEVDTSYAVSENLDPPDEGTVDAVFMLNNEQNLTVPLSFLNSIQATPQQINEALQANATFYLSKPLLSGPPHGGVMGFGADQGILSAYETDIYSSFADPSDPEDCD